MDVPVRFVGQAFSYRHSHGVPCDWNEKFRTVFDEGAQHAVLNGKAGQPGVIGYANRPQISRRNPSILVQAHQHGDILRPGYPPF